MTSECGVTWAEPMPGPDDGGNTRKRQFAIVVDGPRVGFNSDLAFCFSRTGNRQLVVQLIMPRQPAGPIALPQWTVAGPARSSQLRKTYLSLCPSWSSDSLNTFTPTPVTGTKMWLFSLSAATE